MTQRKLRLPQMIENGGVVRGFLRGCGEVVQSGGRTALTVFKKAAGEPYGSEIWLNGDRGGKLFQCSFGIGCGFDCAQFVVPDRVVWMSRHIGLKAGETGIRAVGKRRLNECVLALR